MADPGVVTVRSRAIQPPWDGITEVFLLDASGRRAMLEMAGFELALAGTVTVGLPGTVVEFRGATVFDLRPSSAAAGVAARALAVRVADPLGEEVPVFRAVWIEPPPPGGLRLRLHALLDGPSCTAAVVAEIDRGRPGAATVEVALYPREEIRSVGLAPLTGGYLYGSGDAPIADDWRPAVHDAEGLWMLNGAGERIWRPLANPRDLQLSAFADTSPRGYALVQRHRSLADYLDPAAAFERRPTMLVEPLGDWGEGWVTLVEIPTRSEENDNIGVFWQPARPFVPGGEFVHRYRLRAIVEPPAGEVSATIVAVRSGAEPAADLEEARRFVVVYALTATALAAGTGIGGARVSVRAETAKVEAVAVHPISGTTLATSFVLRRPQGALVDFRADLYFDDGNPAEVLLHRWA